MTAAASKPPRMIALNDRNAFARDEASDSGGGRRRGRTGDRASRRGGLHESGECRSAKRYLEDVGAFEAGV
jgi:hypothetical protein